MSETKICKNCKYLGEYKECRHPNSLVQKDFVEGNDSYSYAATMRIDKCGPSAKFYEQVEPETMIARVFGLLR